jgi:hypothetical protein
VQDLKLQVLKILLLFLIMDAVRQNDVEFNLNKKS